MQDTIVLGKLTELVDSLCTQLYYPVEHVAWAADQQLVAVNSTPIWTVAIILWALPLLITLMRTLKQLFNIQDQLQFLRGRTSIPTGATSVQKLKSQQFSLLLGVVQTLCDLGMAVFWMPPGFLWAGKLPALWWGLLGTISSILGLYRTIKCQ